MKAKRMILLGTMAAALSIGGSFTGGKTSAQSAAPSLMAGGGTPVTTPAPRNNKKDEFRDILGISSDKEIYYALYEGQSLADIAAERNRDVGSLIDLQIREMDGQLDARLAAGSLTAAQYEAQKAELPELILRSIYGLRNL
jgi:hypothetical protein